MSASVFNKEYLKSVIVNLEGRISKQQDGLERLEKLLNAPDDRNVEQLSHKYLEKEFTNLINETEEMVETLESLSDSYSANQSEISSSSIIAEIAEIETTMEDIRNRRQELATAFENFDQKANQLFNILSAVLKSIKEMKSGVSRNLL